MNSFEGLFSHFLKDVYYAENRILQALPQMADAALSDDLKDAFVQHEIETKGQIQRLEQVFELMDQPVAGVKCEAIEGLIMECEEMLDENKQAGPVRDAGLIACGQAIEHYEIARYGSLVAWAKEVGMDDAVFLLEMTLGEEKRADMNLTEIAQNSINERAAQAA